jgi:predicted dehydrogenase
MRRVSYQFEYEQRLRCAFIGAGGHSYRNIYPSFQYAPIDLVAVCDRQPDRAATYARIFGGGNSYDDHHQMLKQERPDAVFIVTSYDEDGRVQATDLALDCLAAGVHVWMEKPTAASVAEIRQLQAAAEASGRFVMTGLKKIFTPAMVKAKTITESAEFGGITSITVRYPQSLPDESGKQDPRRMVGFLDHIYHPGAVLAYLGGRMTRFSYEQDPVAGGSVAALRFESGAVASLHLAGGVAHTSPVERVEVVGRGANLVIDDGVRLTYYRPGANVDYGRSGSYVVDDEVAPLVWQPEHSLGQLYNKNLFYLGYVPEILHFCEAIQTGAAPTNGTLDQSLAIMHLYDAYRRTPPGQTVQLPVAQ